MKINNITTTLFLLLFGYSFAQKKWDLQECVEYALQNNIAIKQIYLDGELAHLNLKDAQGNFMPNINGQISHSWNVGLNTDITTGILRNQTTQFTAMGVSANVDIYKGLQNQNRLQRAKLTQISALYQQTKIAEDISINIVNAYLQILFNKENIKIQKQQFIADSLQLERSKLLVESGMIPRGDLFEIKATIAADKQLIIQYEYQLLISKMSLAHLLQLKDFNDFDIVDVAYEFEVNPIFLQSPEDIYRKALTERVELKIAQNNIAIAQKDIAISKGAYQPQLSGFYSFSSRVSYAQIPDGFGGLQDPLPFWEQIDLYKGHNFGLQLNIPIFNGFAVRNNVNKAKTTLEKQQLEFEQAQIDLERSIYTAFADAKGALESYIASEEALKAREEAFRYASERLNNGMSTAFDYSQSQSLLINAKSEVLRNKYDYLFRTKILEIYFGIPVIPQ
ncbi:MAG: TolC family protein [Bacteroidota bacterium]|nr:TolC family protein [Bacteroidota bacterium]